MIVASIDQAKKKLPLMCVWVCWRRKKKVMSIPRYLPGSVDTQNVSGKGSYSLTPLLTSVFQDFPVMIVALFFASVLSRLANGERSTTATAEPPGNCWLFNIHKDFVVP